MSKDVNVVGLVGVMLLLLPGWGKLFLVLVLWIAGVIVALAILVEPVTSDEAWECLGFVVMTPVFGFGVES